MRILPALFTSPLALVVAAAACGPAADESAEPEVASACAENPSNSVYAEAFDQYLVGLNPTPRRFLSAAGTDSALPEAIFQGVQAKGPTYFYPGDDAGRQQVLAKLSSVGNWPTLLVLHRGTETQSDTTVAIRLAGHYVGGADDGKAAPAKSVIFACDTVPWRFVRSDVVTP